MNNWIFEASKNSIYVVLQAKIYKWAPQERQLRRRRWTVGCKEGEKFSLSGGRNTFQSGSTNKGICQQVVSGVVVESDAGRNTRSGSWNKVKTVAVISMFFKNHCLALEWRTWSRRSRRKWSCWNRKNYLNNIQTNKNFCCYVCSVVRMNEARFFPDTYSSYRIQITALRCMYYINLFKIT